MTANLDDYAKLVPAADRAQVRRSVARLESAFGAHTFPMDVWIDSGHRVRRLALSFSECLQSQRLRLAMTMDVFD